MAQWQAWPHATGDSTDQGQLVASPPNPPWTLPLGPLHPKPTGRVLGEMQPGLQADVREGGHFEEVTGSRGLAGRPWFEVSPLGSEQASHLGTKLVSWLIVHGMGTANPCGGRSPRRAGLGSPHLLSVPSCGSWQPQPSAGRPPASGAHCGEWSSAASCSSVRVRSLLAPPDARKDRAHGPLGYGCSDEPQQTSSSGPEAKGLGIRNGDLFISLHQHPGPSVCQGSADMKKQPRAQGPHVVRKDGRGQ